MKRARSYSGYTPYKKRRYARAYRPTPIRYYNLVAKQPIMARTTTTTVEKKAIDTDATQQVNTTGAFTLINPIVPGTDFMNRIGRKIRVKSVYLRGFISTEASIAPTTGINTSVQQARLIVFVDLQPNGATPATTDLLTVASTAGHLNLNNRDRFKILIDKYFVFDPIIYNTTATQSVATASRQIWSIKKFKKIEVETIFNAGTAGTIADINSGALYVFTIGSQAAGADTDINSGVLARVRFTDV